MFPRSPDARAKMKMTSGQSELLPLSTSFLVFESCRATGFAAAKPTNARIVETFMA